ncbi:MAG: hypothetical protein QXF00_04155 [Desulfurococcaceae archaeon]
MLSSPLLPIGGRIPIVYTKGLALNDDVTLVFTPLFICLIARARLRFL